MAPFISIFALPLSILILEALLQMLVAFVNVLLILAKILSICLACYIVASPLVALLNGFFYFLHLCMDDRKSVLLLQVGVLDNMRELQKEFAQIADTSNSDAMKFEDPGSYRVLSMLSFGFNNYAAMSSFSLDYH
ncbi:hypothetical protein AgCh_022315 [Apium graveolens]